ncbi:MAG: polyprenyl synthetase family protein [Eubacterium sp.]|nr:polyprenyl synthetase family protein [Eubacterium sp.]
MTDQKMSSETGLISNLNQVVSYVEKTIKNHLPEAADYPAKTIEAMNYAMSAGGKRIRPTLMMLSFKALGGEDYMVDTLKAFMSAMEMIHTHSLIHDDLPALDNDSLRRGRPTVHVQYDEAIGILSGDALLNYAYETVTKSFSDSSLELEKALDNDLNSDLNSDYCIKKLSLSAKALRKLSYYTGIDGMLGGQSLDVEKTGLSVTESERDYIYHNKTGALIAGSLVIGAVLAGAGDQAVASMEEAGYAIGNAFQVQDDILDETGNEVTLGKEVGQDSRNSKNTYVSSYGLDKAHQYVMEETKKANELISGQLKNREAYKTEKKSKDLNIDPHTAGKILLDLVNSMADRNK